MMKDKFKGLVVGLLLGTMVTGSLAYAATGKTINVTFPKLKLMFDGVEKPLADKTPALVYNNTTYVPLRYVLNALGQEMNADSATGQIWIGKNYGGKAKAAVAKYKGGQITQVELDTYLAFSTFYYGQTAPADKTPVVKQLIAVKLLAAKSASAHSKEAAKAAAEELERIRAYFGTGSELTAELKRQNLTEFDLTEQIKQNYLVEKTLNGMVTTAAVKAEYDRQRQADPGAFVKANVRHILVAFNDPATGKSLRSDEEALARAIEVREKLVAGGDFAALAKTYSDDDGSKANGGLYANAELSQFVEPFKLAAAKQQLNAIGEPVKTVYGYHVIKVDSRTVQTLDQVKDQLKQQLLNQTFQNYLNKDVQGLIESIKLPAAAK